MKSSLVLLIVFLLLKSNLQANPGNNSTILITQSLQEKPSFLQIKDDSGNNFIIWEEKSTTTQVYPRIFTQKTNLIGEVLWGKSVELSIDRNKIQNAHKIISDGIGGIIITWEERSIKTEETDIYAQHLDSLGRKLWGTRGIAICASIGSQITPMITTDGNGGAIIAWTDSRNDFSYMNWDIYAQHVTFNGDVAWEKEGVLISSDIKDEYLGKVLSGPEGSVTIIWNKVIPTISGIDEGYEFYFRKLNSRGEWIQTLANENFLTLPAGSTDYALGGDILSDGNEGFFLSLAVNASDEMNTNVYLQHVLATGDLAFAGTYGLLIDNSIVNSKANFETDTAGNVLVQWISKEEDNTVVRSKKFDRLGNPLILSSYVTTEGGDQDLYTKRDTISITGMSSEVTLSSTFIQPKIAILNDETQKTKRKAVPKSKRNLTADSVNHTNILAEKVIDKEADSLKLVINIQKAPSRPIQAHTIKYIKISLVAFQNPLERDLLTNTNPPLDTTKGLNYLKSSRSKIPSLSSIDYNRRQINQNGRAIILPYGSPPSG